MSIQWKVKDVIYVFLLHFMLLFAAPSILKIFGIDLDLENSNSSLISGIVIYQWIVLLLPIWFFTFKKYGSQWEDFGFRKFSVWKSIKYIFGAYLFMFGIFWVLSYLISLGLEIPGFSEQEAHLPLFGSSGVDIFLAVLIMVILAPLVEEIAFRGFVLQALAKKWGRMAGTILTAAIFAGIHFEFQSFLGLFILALIVNELFLRSKSIWVPMAFHILNNSIALLVEFSDLQEAITV